MILILIRVLFQILASQYFMQLYSCLASWQEMYADFFAPKKS